MTETHDYSPVPGNSASLAGVRIVELAQFVFVPGGSAILSDHGAEVIHIEPPEGDPYRSLKIDDGRQSTSVNMVMEQNNRNKLSVVIDLKKPEGYEAFVKLIKTADVFITSLRVDALKRLNADVDDLRAHNPKLIYVRGNALGFRGEQAGRPGYDASSFWARGGFAHTLSLGHTKNVLPRPALGDHSGASNIAMGIAMALFRRERTGEPSLVDVSLLSTAMWVLSSDIAQSQSPSYDDNAITEIQYKMPLTKAYKTRDGRWIQLMFLDPERYWKGFCDHLGVPELADDPRFSSASLRSKNGRELIEELSSIFATHDYAHWKEAFSTFDAPWELAQTVKEVLNDPQAQANNYTFNITAEDGTPVRVIAGPVSVDGEPLHVTPRRAPSLAEHTDEVLRSAGFSEAELQTLRAQGAIR